MSTPFETIVQRVGEQAAEQAMSALAKSLGEKFTLDDHALKDIVQRALFQWISANVTPVILARLDARKAEILDAVGKAVDAIPAITQERLVHFVRARFTDRYGNATEELARTLFGRTL
jgi:hypothetical protein